MTSHVSMQTIKMIITVTNTNRAIGARKWTAFLCIVILCLFSRGFGQTLSDSQDSIPYGRINELEKLSVYQQGDVYRYQARCTIACDGNYAPNTLYITLNLDRVTFNFHAFGNFEASQDISSNIWWIKNRNWLSENNGQCQFDFRFDYNNQQPEPTGTCQLGWNMSTECLVPETTGLIEGNRDCIDIAEQDPLMCYDHHIYSKCCQACSFRADEQQSSTDIYCPYGNRASDTVCDGLQQQNCYVDNFTCCGTCAELEEEIPGCRYGNRDPSVCDFIIYSDCYNKTTETNCCYECHNIANEDNPDCRYGNKATWCSNLDRNQCYRTDTENTCCQTCSEFNSDFIPNCEYGDRQNDCYTYTPDECQNNNNIRNECCETCNYLIENDCYGDRRQCGNVDPSTCYEDTVRTSCCTTCLDSYDITLGEDCVYGDRNTSCWFDTLAHHCYDEAARQRCCDTCFEHADWYQYEALENCTYGDRRPNLCINISGPMCYNGDVAVDCCQSCSYFVLDHLPPTCKYGNKEECPDTLAFECYMPSVESRCCETCHSFNRTEEQGYDCRYGDKIDSCYNRPLSSCYDENSRSTCCRYCQTQEDLTDPDCPYGDRLAMCTTTLVPSMCYTLENECCRMCDYMVKPHLDSTTCKYGDRRDCSNIPPSSCYSDTVAYDCCETCYNLQTGTTCEFGDSADCSNLTPWQCYDREQECCASCAQYVKPNQPVTCKYGDKQSFCAAITAYDCYDLGDVCCETCARYWRNDLPDNCSYGDKSTICESEEAHGSFCYNATILDQCCEACQDWTTNNPNCLYGDKDIKCLLIEAHNCYRSDIEPTCCKTCPEYYRPNYPTGCGYGDHHTNCRQSSCTDYSPDELQDCCYTCRSYITTTPTTSTTSTTLASNTGTEKSSGGAKSTTRETRTTQERTTTGFSQTPTTGLPVTYTPSPLSTTNNITRTTNMSTGISRITNDIPSTTRVTRDVTRASTTHTVTDDVTDDVTTSTTESPSGIVLSLNDIFGSTGAIVGGVVGAIVVLAIIIAVAVYCLRARNKSPESNYKQSNFDPPDSRRQNQLLGTPGASAHYNPNGQVSYNTGRYNEQPKRAPPKRQESEEVYDYINPDDVKTVVSMPITRRPTLPERNGGAENTYEPYLEPTKSDEEPTGYDNLAMRTNDAYSDRHQYFVLEKEPERL